MPCLDEDSGYWKDRCKAAEAYINNGIDTVWEDYALHNAWTDLVNKEEEHIL